ncbi:MAG TPA: hypothetical protein VN969_37885 [Streptosporangiaceae bacterium]|nr:hypothetical protein [Streptosporangiaceae bacterium]
MTDRRGGIPNGACGLISATVPAPHVADGEIHWPSIEGSPYAGQIWAVEVELTPKTLARTTRIMSRLLTPATRYAQVVYLTSPPARPVVTRSAEAFSQVSEPGSLSGTCPWPRACQDSSYEPAQVFRGHPGTRVVVAVHPGTQAARLAAAGRDRRRRVAADPGSR